MLETEKDVNSRPHAQLRLLVEACSSLLSDPESEGLVENIVRLAQRFVLADAYALWRRSQSGETWKVNSSAGLSSRYETEAAETTSPLPDVPVAFENVYEQPSLAPRWPEYRSEGIQSMLTIPLRQRGKLTGALVFYHRTSHVFSDEEMIAATALRSLAAAALNTADLYNEQRKSRAGSEEAAKRAAFLANAGALLASSLDVHRTLEAIAGLAVPTIADWCAVDLLSVDGGVRRVAAKHIDPRKIELVRALHQRYPQGPQSLFFRSLEDRQSAFVPEITDEMLVAGAEDDEHLEILRELGLKSIVYAPLVAHDRSLGMLTMATAESGRHFQAEDISFLEELAQRAAFAVHSARLHEEVSESAARLRLAAAAAKLGIFEWEVDKDAALWENERMFEIFGRTHEQGPLGRTEFFESVVHSEDAESVWSAIAGSMTAGGQLHVVCRITRGDGETRWIEFAGLFEPVKDGNSLRLISVVADVTERRIAEEQIRESEERLRFALQSGDLGSWELNLDSFQATRSFEHDKIFGYAELVKDWEYSRFLSHVIDDDRDSIDREILQAAERKSDFDFEARIRRTDGEVRWIWVSARYFDRPPRSPRFIGVIADVTNRKRFEERLRETAKLESIGVLAGGVAHDFNNLLTGILGNASLALDILDDGHPVHEPLQEVVKASERAAGLTRQLLAYSGRGKLATERMDLSALAGETVMLIRKLIAPTIDLTMDLDKDISLIAGDPVQIQQVVMNLIINAAEALGSEGKLAIRTEECDLDEESIHTLAPMFEMKPGRYVCLGVEDTGCGMDQATLAKIFDPFFTTKFTGRGLGLSAVLGIVRAHKGSLKVTSQPGVGTKFQVLFPRVLGKADADSRRSSKVGLQGRGTVLLADDEGVIRRTLGMMLARLGYRVLTAENGQEAVALFGEHSGLIDLVFLDLSMPVMGGEQALAGLREIRPDVKVIISTGLGESEEVHRLNGLGVAGMLQKPYTVTQLKEALRKVDAARAV